MVLSRGLVISLGVSALGCTLLFLYFRNKITAVEKKVDIMFDLIQNHQKQQNQQQMNMRENMHMNTEQEFEETDNMVSQEEISGWTENVKSDKELIQVSDDEEDDDSEEISDSDSEDEEDEIPKLSLAKTEDMTLEINDVKKIVVQEATKAINTELNEPEDVTDSLDEIDVDEDEDEDEEEEDNGMEHGDEEVVVAKLDDEFDYNKLKVSELKSLAAAKKLDGYKSLKKGPLIELLKSSE
jgi:hypothetical protein